jgi:glucose-1-phosphate cytidylyltransferase
MKVAILSGGLGTRLQEETSVKPKPMVEIGGRPILWHIMKLYSAYGIDEFVVALGYKGEVVKNYFLNYRYHTSSLTLRLASGEAVVQDCCCEDWTVHLLDTGLSTQTGGRVKRVIPFIGSETFMLTYGDGLSDVNIADVLAFHRSHGKLATVTAVRPPARFGGIRLDGERVTDFTEKPQIGEGWINGGFFVLEPQVADYINGDETIFEQAPLDRLAGEGQLMAYRHGGFWQCMDTLRELRLLENLWQGGHAPWKVWKE